MDKYYFVDISKCKNAFQLNKQLKTFVTFFQVQDQVLFKFYNVNLPFIIPVVLDFFQILLAIKH